MMTFHESYGYLPTPILSLIKRFNVSPADINCIINRLNAPTWDEVGTYIVSNSEMGMFRMPLPW